MRYCGRIFRPPSEAYSLIVQVTYGCSHNTCAFCDMYREKRFALRPMAEILEDFAQARREYGQVQRIFLADGDALIRRTGELVQILEEIRRLFPSCERVSSYASPASLLGKSEEALRLLRDRGLQMVYLGLESGCDEVLAWMQKGYSAGEITQAGQKARRCGLQLSVTAIAGLGSHRLSAQHAADTARVLSAMAPEYIGILTLEVLEDTPLWDWVRQGSFTLLNPIQVLRETRALVEQLDSPGSVFRMNHASNYLPLRGTLNRDREQILRQIDAAIDGQIRLRPEWLRSL